MVIVCCKAHLPSPRYSTLNASIGSNRAALRASTNPDTSLTPNATEDAATILQTFDIASFAWFFHDIAVGEPDHELAGVCQAEKVIRQFGLSTQFADSVREAIMATAHQQDSQHKQGTLARIVADTDLAIFGKSPEIYARYARQVRREYLGYSEQEYAAGRTKVLTGFLWREPLYTTRWFADKYTDTARANIKQELASLADI